MRTILLMASILLAGVALIGIIGQRVATAQDSVRYPMPGTLVDVGGHRLHFHITGEASDAPTIILEAGNGGFSAQWVRVQEQLSSQVQVVSYDRAGFGWSDPDPQPRSIEATAQQLHAGLAALDIAPPYVLVGHSMGGLFVRSYAAQYPDEVVGIVLVDAAHPDQWQHFPPDIVAQQTQITRLMQGLQPLSHLGVLRLVHPLESVVTALPLHERDVSLALSATPRYVATFTQETALVNALPQSMPPVGTLEDMPLRVLSADSVPAGQSAPEDYFTIAHRLQADLATLSSQAEWRILNESDHFSIIMAEDHAQAVAAAVFDVVQRTHERAASVQ